MPTNTTGPIKDVSKEVKYLNKDFEGFRNDLIGFAKTYFPTTYTDFNESSPGMMFIEMAAYIGDVLSYYVDSQFKESILAYAEEKRTIYNIAQSLGYKPKTGVPASCKVDVYCTVPAQGSADSVTPNWSYAPTIGAGMRLSTTANTAVFRTTEPINFQVSSSIDPTYFEKYQDTRHYRRINLGKLFVIAQDFGLYHIY